jgi:hypothetical protein
VVKEKEVERGPIANSTLIHNKTINFEETFEQTKAGCPKYALGFAGLTYIPGATDAVKRQLLKYAPNLKVACRPPSKVSQVFSDMKHKLETGQNSFVVYKIPCKECRRVYIGETTRKLYERCSQHETDVKNVDKKPKKSALVQHVHKTKHEFDFGAATILKKVRTKRLLKIHEANQIILHEDVACNFKKDAEYVSPVFYNLIKEHGKWKKKFLNVNPAFSTGWNDTDYPANNKSQSEQSGNLE